MRIAVPVIVLSLWAGQVHADPADPAAGAVPVPADDLSATLPLAERDTTVTDGDLAKITGWPAARRSRRSGDVWVALRTDDKAKLHLSVIGHDEGIVEDYPIGAAQQVRTHAFEDNLFPGRGGFRDDTYQGRIIFAVRVTPPGANTPDQLVVYRDGRLVRVARRALGATAWRPVLSVAFSAGTAVSSIETTDPH